MNSFQKIYSWLMKPRGKNPAEEAMRRLRDAKPGELVELPSGVHFQSFNAHSHRNPFIPPKPMRGCQIPSGCQCSNREMAMRCNYWDRREAEHDKHLNDLLRITPYIGMLWMSLCLGGIFAIVGAIGLLVLERMP